jgi:hypothetical protein
MSEGCFGDESPKEKQGPLTKEKKRQANTHLNK